MQDQSGNKRAILIITAIGGFLAPFMASSINIALPFISKEFSLTAKEIGWVATTYLLTATVFLVPFGKIADMVGRRKIYSYGIGIFMAGSFMATFMPNANLFFLSRIIQGIGASMVFSTGIAMVTLAFPPEKRGKVLGINVSATYLGLTSGPVLGGILTHYMGWKSIFYANGILCFIVLLLVLIKVTPEKNTHPKQHLDKIGSVLYGVSIGCIMYGFADLTALINLLLFIGGCISLAAFMIYESRIENPVMHTDLLLKNRVFAFSNLAALVSYSATFGVGFLISLYLQYAKGLKPHEAGFLMITQPVIMVLMSPVTGKLSDRVEPRILSSAGIGITIAGLFCLSIIHSDTSLLQILGAMFLLGCGYALFLTPNSNAVMGSVDKSHYGVASAILGTIRLLGQVFSMGIVMMVLSINIGNSTIDQSNINDFVPQIHSILRIFIVLSIIGIILSLNRGKVHQER
jgi:EmrB/QacA subfamily drug resistance transporter